MKVDLKSGKVIFERFSLIPVHQSNEAKKILDELLKNSKKISEISNGIIIRPDGEDIIKVYNQKGQPLKFGKGSDDKIIIKPRFILYLQEHRFKVKKILN